MNERKFDMNRDGLGLLLFALGLFPAVLIVKALLSTVPVETVSGDGPIALSWIRSLGGIPSLLFTGGIIFLGGRLFLFGKRDTLVRDAIGIAGVALASSILLGAFSPTAGGNIGYATGGLVSSVSHVVVGVLFGLIALALSIWFPWLREERAPRIATVPESGAGGVILDEEADTGVSAEEAAALIPEDLNRAIDEGRKQLAVKPVRSAPPPSPYPEDVRLKGQIPPGARPLNPEQDVRTETPSAAQPSSVYRWTAPRTDRPADGVGEDLAGGPEPEVVFAAEPYVGEATWSEAAGIVDADSPEAVADPIAVEREEVGLELELNALSEETAGILAIDPAANASAEPLSSLPRPSWEQSSLFTEADEPVDAYGTPLTLVEALRQDVGTNAPNESEAVAIGSGDPVSVLPTETDFAPELEAGSEDEPEFEEVEIVSARGARVELVEEDLTDDEVEFEETDEEVEAFEDGDEEEDEDESEGEAEDEDEAEEGEEDELESQDDEDEVEEDEEHLLDRGDEIETPGDLEVAPASTVANELAVVAEAPIAEDEEAEPVNASETPALGAIAVAVEMDRPTRTSIEAATRAPNRPVVASTPPPAPVPSTSTNDGPLVHLMEQRSQARSDDARNDDARSDVARNDVPTARPVAERPSDSTTSKTTRRAPAAKAAEKSVERNGEIAADAGQRDVILKPRAAPPEKAIKSQPALPERAELLREAGCLFVERGRVAVSMLQRQYGMDFDQACAVLDELQNLGLIGPYLGGQRRDILLTREQWLEKVGSA